MRDEGYCPICGKAMDNPHRCPPRVLASIDAANTRAWEPSPLADPQRRPVSERIDEGFRMVDPASGDSMCEGL